MKVGDAMGSSRDPVPAGVYAFEVVDSPDLENPSVKDGKQGRQVSVLSNVIDNPEHEGKGMWQNFGITKGGLFYMASFLVQSGFCDESQDMGEPYAEDDIFMDFLASLKGHRYMAEVTLEQVYSKKMGAEIDVNKVVSVWPYEEPKIGKVPAAAEKLLGPKTPAKAPLKASVGPKASAPSSKKAAPPKRDLPPWAKGAEEGEEVQGDEIPI